MQGTNTLAEALRGALVIVGSALGEPPLPLQTSCPYVFEDPYRPPDILRKAYSRKLKERARQRKAKSSGLEQQAQLQFSSKVLEE